MHDAGHFKGMSLLKHVREISALVSGTDSHTLLDYGCGRGVQYNDTRCHLYWGGIMPALYDPAVSEHNIRPVGKFDGVICTDVAEHIPEDEVDDFLKDLFEYAEKFVFITVCTRPAVKKLPDGRNSHLTIKSEDWWFSKIKYIAGNYPSIQYKVSWNNT